ncbi:MAG: DUF1948 domain-containing protein [Candidatus Ureaplasma intestinipullorum]|uniref:DUF1948 domain-containing protein n=1 Tax=Candidatus Ureaplasma intestinipullorum TaxID=2838770 RepID=A0A9E2KVH4_9BACT|nr:DUF1948 domain-containing protein [Candidatus Ureaplasma intestinipullorum]
MSNSDSKILTQWEKRVKLTKFFYTYLIKFNIGIDINKEAIEDFNLDAEQLKVFEYFLNNKSKIIDLINENTNKNWDCSRLNLVDQAVLFETYSESKVLNTNKHILIDQALITIKKYSDYDNYKYINAILDKIL